MRGVFISLEGQDGSGKSTVAQGLAAALREQGREVVLTREPGGTGLGERVRGVLLDEESLGILPTAEAMLFAASRAQLVAEVISPAIERGAVVVTDRFTDSSLAYQWGGRGLDLAALRSVQALATGGLEPDLTLLLDLPVTVAMARQAVRKGTSNRLDRELQDFHTRVREAYHVLAASDTSRWRTIDAARDVEHVLEAVWQAVIASGLLETHAQITERAMERG